MKKPLFYLLFICLALLAQLVWAGSRAPVTLNRLQEVNFEWRHQPEATQLNLSGEPAADEREILRTHLRLVEMVLRQQPVNHLTAIQRQNRIRHLDNLHDYWQNEGLPINTTHSYRLPIFIDEQDNFCAVGHLLKSSGSERVAREIAAKQRYAYLKDIRHPELTEWASISGLTLEELAWIQPAYPVSVAANSLNGGTDGPVHALLVDQATGTLYAAGDFTSAGGVSGFNNIAAWTPGFAGYFWMPLGNGLGSFQSPVRTLCMYNGELYAGGSDLLPTGASNGVARWNGSQWVTPGPLGGTISKLFVWRDSLYAAVIENISVPPTNISRLYCLTQNSWQPRGVFNGAILDAVLYQNEMVLGGEFTLANGVSSQFITRYNGNQFSAMGGGVSLPVRALEVHKDTLYAGGDFINPLDTTQFFGLAHWSGSAWVNELSGMNIIPLSFDSRINDLSSIQNRLMVGGKFPASGMGVMGNNLAFFQRNYFGSGTNNLFPVTTMDSAVFAMAAMGTDLMIGGEFETLVSQTPNVHHIAGIDISNFLAVDHILKEVETMQAFPNPAQDAITVKLPSDSDQLSLYDLCGKQLINQTVLGATTMKLAGIAPGVYILKASQKGKPLGTHRIVKN